MTPLILRAFLGALIAIVAFTAGMRFTQRSPGSVPARDRQVLTYVCPMHPQYRAERPGDCLSCGMRLVRVDAGGERVDGSPPNGTPAAARPGTVLVTPDKQQLIGVRVAAAHRTALTRVRRTVGRVAADETRIYRITAATPGWIEEALPVTEGSRVRRDQRLARFYAPEVLGAQQAYLYALDARDRFARQNAAGAQMASTETQVQTSVDNLRAIGMSRTQIDEIARARERVLTVDVRATANGIILSRNVSQGQRFNPGDELFVIADLSRVWVLADLFEDDRRSIMPGRTARVRYEGETLDARISSVAPTFDSETRTLKARLELDNPGERLRPGMFVDVELSAEMPPAITVPADAVIDSGLRKTVFVDLGDGHFEPREVETGWRVDDQVEITRGLMQGDRVAISGTFLIDSESRMKTAPQRVPGRTAEDPVCHMTVDEARAAAAGRTLTDQGRVHYFCSDDCKRSFAADSTTDARKASQAR